MDKELEEGLATRQRLEEKLKQLKLRLTELNAHKNTLIMALTNNETTLDFPSYIEYNSHPKLIKIDDALPFYIFNLGKPTGTPFSGLDSKDTSYPINYKILRKYKKSILSKSSSDEVFYTTTILKKNENFTVLIKDDENNIWKGQEAFNDFAKSFSEPIIFKNMTEWLGLNNESVRKLYL